MKSDIIGTARCRDRNGQKEAFIPVMITNRSCFFVLTEQDLPIQDGYGIFHLIDESGTELADCTFPTGHEYFSIYEKLLEALIL